MQCIVYKLVLTHALFIVETTPSVAWTTDHTFQCRVCRHVVRSQAEYETHMVTHPSLHVSPLFPCDQCPLVVETSCVLKRHMHLHTESGAVKCSDCFRLFPSKKKMKSAHPVCWRKTRRLFLCRYCDYGLLNEKGYFTHMAEMHPDQPTKETISKCHVVSCLYITDDENEALQHKALHKLPSVLGCPYCPKLLENEDLAECHLARCPSLVSGRLVRDWNKPTTVHIAQKVKTPEDKAKTPKKGTFL